MDLQCSRQRTADGGTRWLRRLASVGLIGVIALSQWGCVSSQRAAEMEAAAAENSAMTGRAAPDFTLPNQDGELVTLSSHGGEWVVLYFYPEDGTPGCTCQAQEFTRSHAAFEQLAANVFGVSPDTVASHAQVAEKFELAIDLLADPERNVMPLYGAWVRTPFGGRVVRSTVLVDPQGTVAYHWPEVIPEGHADRVRMKLEELKAARP